MKNISTVDYFQRHTNLLRVVPGKDTVPKKETSPTQFFLFEHVMCKPRVAKGCSHIPRVSWKAVRRDMLKQNYIFNAPEILQTSKDFRPLTHQNSTFTPFAGPELFVTRCVMKLTNRFQPNSKGLQQNFTILAGLAPSM